MAGLTAPLLGLEKKSLREQALSALRTAITSGELEPGRHLVETELSEMLQISRGTLREALRQLEQEGLLSAGPRGRLSVRHLDEKEIRDRVRKLLDLIQLEWLGDRYPNQLSGGQRQRVALARALAVEPRVLLLDEPFGALDAKVRKELRRWLRRLHDELHVASVFVTHDQEEALEVSDRVAVMNHGTIEQTGTPSQVRNHPATQFVHEFLCENSGLQQVT